MLLVVILWFLYFLKFLSIISFHDVNMDMIIRDGMGGGSFFDLVIETTWISPPPPAKIRITTLISKYSIMKILRIENVYHDSNIRHQTLCIRKSWVDHCWYFSSLAPYNRFPTSHIDVAVGRCCLNVYLHFPYRL